MLAVIIGLGIFLVLQVCMVCVYVALEDWEMVGHGESSNTGEDTEARKATQSMGEALLYETYRDRC